MLSIAQKSRVGGGFSCQQSSETTEVISKNRLLVMSLARRTARPTQFRSRSSTPWASNKSRTIAPSTTISQMAEQTSPRLFISYSHDSREHEDRVRALADRLREDGVDAVVDQYNTAPPDGWPMWMDREIRKADFIALVCTETYLRRVEGREEPGKGRGVLWEAKLIYNYLYLADTAVQRYPDPIARWSIILYPLSPPRVDVLPSKHRGRLRGLLQASYRSAPARETSARKTQGLTGDRATKLPGIPRSPYRAQAPHESRSAQSPPDAQAGSSGLD
jgi:hypothetical protein